jgi:uncharacterized protein YuzB (UPF0349 family)
MVISLMHKIKFCKRNFNCDTQELIKKLEKNYKDVSISTKSCIGYCSNCEEKPIAVVNKDLFTANTDDALYDAIIENLK